MVSINKIYGFDSETALNKFLNEVKVTRGKGFSPIGLAKLMTAFRANKMGFKIKVLNGYKLKYDNIAYAIDYLYTANNTTTNEIKGDNKDMKGNETLKLYETRVKENIRKGYDAEVTKIKNADTNLKKFTDAQELMNSLIDVEKVGKIDVLSKFTKITDKTKKDLKDAEIKRDEAFKELNDTVMEVAARLADTTTKEDADKILLTYEIINDKGVLTV